MKQARRPFRSNSDKQNTLKEVYALAGMAPIVVSERLDEFINYLID